MNRKPITKTSPKYDNDLKDSENLVGPVQIFVQKLHNFLTISHFAERIRSWLEV